jgi:hypothetical protein
MRLYNKNTLKIFQPGEEFWNTYMITKTGEPRKRISYGILKYMYMELGVTLAPSVSTIASGLDGFGAFSAGSQWAAMVTSEVAAEVAMEAMTDKFVTQKNLETKIKSAAQARLSRARDRGTLLHGVFHDVCTGKVKLKSLSDHQRAFYHVCREILLTKIDIPEGSWSTEQVLSCRSMVGTADVIAPKVVLDWKTVEKFRDVHESELGQLAAYAKLSDANEAYLVQIEQESLSFRIVKHMESNEISNYWSIMTTAGKLWELMLYGKLNRTRLVNPTKS